jgi:hypothetical protein
VCALSEVKVLRPSRAEAAGQSAGSLGSARREPDGRPGARMAARGYDFAVVCSGKSRPVYPKGFTQ